MLTGYKIKNYLNTNFQKPFPKLNNLKKGQLFLKMQFSLYKTIVDDC